MLAGQAKSFVPAKLMPLLLTELEDRSLTTCSGQVCRSGECRTMQQQAARQAEFDFFAMIAQLNSLLRLKTTVIGMECSLG